MTITSASIINRPINIMYQIIKSITIIIIRSITIIIIKSIININIMCISNIKSIGENTQQPRQRASSYIVYRLHYEYSYIEEFSNPEKKVSLYIPC